MLSVERQQERTDIPEVAGGGTSSSEVGARTALRAHATREDELVRVLSQPIVQRLAELVGKGENALDVGLRGTRSDDARARLTAKQEIKRVSQHGLPRSGLSGQHVQPRPQAQLGP